MHPGAGRLQRRGEFSRPKDQLSEVCTLSRADAPLPPAPGLQVGGQSIPAPFPPDVGRPPRMCCLVSVRLPSCLSGWTLLSFTSYCFVCPRPGHPGV